jgi:hypothetical protein
LFVGEFLFKCDVAIVSVDALYDIIFTIETNLEYLYLVIGSKFGQKYSSCEIKKKVSLKEIVFLNNVYKYRQRKESRNRFISKTKFRGKK